jgi:nucleotide-binding universal stress UspA family protein
MQRIVVPLDGSPLAEAVLPTAVELGQALQAEWVLVQVVAPPPVVWGMEAGVAGPAMTWDPDGMVADEKAAARAYLEKVRRALPDPTRTVIDVREDVMPLGILHAAAAHHATYIAMSTHGRGGVGRLLMGSVTDSVMRLSPVPIVVVRPGLAGFGSRAGEGAERRGDAPTRPPGVKPQARGTGASS